MTPPFKIRGETKAFSLIEVVFAVALVAFALITIVGTIPMGLQTMRASENDAAIGMIANQMRGDLQQISFGTGAGSLSALTGSNYYYTVEGIKTDLTGTEGPAYYKTQFAVTNAAINGTAYGGTTAAPNNAAAITVTLLYPYPSDTQTNSFGIFATDQNGTNTATGG